MVQTLAHLTLAYICVISMQMLSTKREHTGRSTFLAINQVHTEKCVKSMELQSCNRKNVCDFFFFFF